jgi:deazaflavin-dependent oxidoreductase (nitroreductase family)
VIFTSSLSDADHAATPAHQSAADAPASAGMTFSVTVYRRGFGMPFPRWLARVNLHVTNRILGPLATRLPGMGVIIHEGRKTRRRFRTPVLVFPRGRQFIIALTYGRESQWVQNVLAEGGCELETAGRFVHLTNPRVFHDARRSMMPAVVRIGLRLLNVSDFLEASSEG